MSQDAATLEMLAALRAALCEAVLAPTAPAGETPESPDAEDAVSPRAAAANVLNTLAMQARDAYWETGDPQGEAACALLGDLCLYVVDPLLRDTMLALAERCLAGLEEAQHAGAWTPLALERLQREFESARPAADDAAAIARALGMSEEEASAFGLTGQIAPVGLDEDELAGDWPPAHADEDAGATPLAAESLETLFRRDARELLDVTLPRALQRYWRNQASMDALLALRRAFHTLKGDAAVTAQSVADAPEGSDLAGLSRLAEAAEDVIDERLGDEHEDTDRAPALPAGAFGLLNDAQAFLLRRLEQRAALQGEAALLQRLEEMQARSRALRTGVEAPAEPRPEDAATPTAVPRFEVVRPAQAERRRGGDRRSAGSRLLATFLSEAAKLMADLHRALARLSDEPSDENALVRARVKLHTLKGGATLAGPEAAGIERLAHACEDILETIEDYQLSGSLAVVPAEVLNAVLDAEDALQALLDDLHAGLASETPRNPVVPTAPDVAALVERLGAVKARVAAGELAAAPAELHAEAVAAPEGTVDRAAEPPSELDGVTAQPPRPALAPLPTLQIGETTRPATAALDRRDPPRGPATAVAWQTTGTAVPDTARPQSASFAIQPWLTGPPVPAGTAGPAQQLEAIVEGPQSQAPSEEPARATTREDGPRAALRALEDQQVSRDALELLLRTITTQAAESRRASARLRDLAARVEQELAGLRLELVKTTRRSGEWDALEKEEYTAIDVLLMQLDEALADQQEAETLLRRELAEARAQNESQADLLLRAQHALLDMSMVPLASLEARLDHAVRSVARRLNKTVVFQMEGGEVLLDHRIAESLFNPLMLLVNNALDHGIEEKAAERVAAGKPSEGHVVVRGRADGDSVTIEIGDDGRGIDPERLVAMAISKGLVEAHQAAAMTPAERIALIWRPGFSTARQVGPISGRGMGMKSVQDDINALQGQVEIRSEPGRGATFVISLPRSLAMMRVHLVREGQHVVAVPITDLACTHAVSFDDVVAVPGGQVVRVGARTLAVYGAHLSAGPAGDGVGARHAGGRHGILLEVEGRQGGLLVDEVLQSQYLPVRPAPSYLQRACGVLGYALGAGGMIMPILDVQTVIARSAAGASVARSERATGSDEPYARRYTVLVVDDSQTMRRALSQTFGRAGFAVREANNGRDALAAISRDKPDLITLDMEMPGMDGLETLSALRLLPGSAAMPVFMITSRQQARHRAAALAAGVSRYFTKPYDEDELAGAARLALAGGLAGAQAAS